LEGRSGGEGGEGATTDDDDTTTKDTKGTKDHEDLSFASRVFPVFFDTEGHREHRGSQRFFLVSSWTA
jgi:hypothetical protein